MKQTNHIRKCREAIVTLQASTIKFFNLLMALVLFTTLSSNAQVNYFFTASSKPYVPVTGGTSPHLTSNYTGWEVEDEGFANVPIGFNFCYNGKSYSQANIDVNGFITLEGTLDIWYNFGYYINILEGYPPYNKRPVIAPFWDDLLLTDTLNLVYKTTGQAPFRVFTVEWKQIKWVYETPDPTLSFELKLYETTNIIEFHYKDEGGSLPNPQYTSASIGITSSWANRNFISLQNTSANPPISLLRANNSLKVKPASNQVYRFIPALLNIPELFDNSLQYSNTKVSFYMNAPGCNSYEYAITQSSVPPSSGIKTFSHNITVSSLQPATTYYIYERTQLFNLIHSQWACDSFTTASNPEPLPYFGNAEGVDWPLIPSNMRKQNLLDTVYDPNELHGWNVVIDYPNIGDRGFYDFHSGWLDGDDWIFTPGLNLIAGITYQLKFGYVALDYNGLNASASFEIKYGKKTGAIAMTSGTLFKDTNIIGTDVEIFKDTVIDFIPAGSGTYYFGLHDMTPITGGWIWVNNVSIMEKPAPRLTANNEKQLQVMAIAPNPAKDILNIQIESPLKTDASLVITDVADKTVITKKIRLTEGDNNLQLAINSLTPGTYILKVTSDDGSRNDFKKFVKE